MPRPHPHAENMLRYAQDAQAGDRPWLPWHHRQVGAFMWVRCESHPQWLDSEEYQRIALDSTEVLRMAEHAERVADGDKFMLVLHYASKAALDAAFWRWSEEQGKPIWTEEWRTPSELHPLWMLLSSSPELIRVPPARFMLAFPFGSKHSLDEAASQWKAFRNNIVSKD